MTSESCRSAAARRRGVSCPTCVIRFEDYRARKMKELKDNMAFRKKPVDSTPPNPDDVAKLKQEMASAAARLPRQIRYVPSPFPGIGAARGNPRRHQIELVMLSDRLSQRKNRESYVSRY